VLEEVKARWGLDRPFILNVGTLEPRKNQTRLIQAYAMLKERTQLPHQLVIAGGRGWLYEDIFRRVNELGLKQDVRFLGYVAEEDLPALYNLADVFVFPSVYEGFGLPPLEAMACGTPVICSNSSSLPEVVGDAAIQVRPGDPDALVEAMEEVLNDGMVRQRLRDAGVEQAKRFSWEAAAQRLLSIYENF
jgi:glycosyltransferase involved in cell wall biosynthesis